jgi:hypothetical protein
MRMKHIKTDYHFIRNQILKKLLEVRFISIAVADRFTKLLSPGRLLKFQRNLT